MVIFERNKIDLTKETKLESIEVRIEYFRLLRENLLRNLTLLNKQTFLLLIIGLLYFLLINSKITELAFGSIKFKEYTIAIQLIPLIFAYLHYKIIGLWFETADIMRYFKIFAEQIFKENRNSKYLRIITPFSFIHIVMDYQLGKKKFGFISNILLIPIFLSIIVAPFYFEFYSIKKMICDYGYNDLFMKFLIVGTSVLSILTIFIMIQSSYYDEKENHKKTSTQQ